MRGSLEQARARATDAMAGDWPPALRREDHWDWVGVRDLVAVVLLALAERDLVPVDQVADEDVLAVLDQGADAVRELADVSAATAPATAATWTWLTQEWPRTGSASGQYEGMLRSIGTGSTAPAVTVLTPWAARAVAAGR
jgi:hypothetical protein